ncbi:hypothetical protein [Paenibacillus sp. FSL R7-0337]|uniref:hypothetical protein n=1 Tax=unclassified Paenibacillus TaxID=185978 RepID=UPI00096C7EB9|nr:hypothetical protein [Paenibacillus sp. FSL R7-0337]OMF91394.1 hypothetical protein BK147_22060 [Paenibacillus sp. FSL R7-0337]
MLLHKRSGETYPVSFLALQPYDIQHQMHDWEKGFDWSIYFNQRGIEIYKMVVSGNTVIQGVISFEEKEDHVWVHLIESIPSQRKEFSRVGLHLLAFACKRSTELGFGGAVALQSKIKPRLIHYYTSIVGASHFGGGLIVIDETVAKRLIMLYFP